jgi:hypothetical protein
MIYGNLNNWIKSYDDLKQPTAIEVDPDGRVYIVEEQNSQITVLKIVGEDLHVQLVNLYRIHLIKNPSDVAYHDNGTSLDTSDDHLYVTSGTKNTVYKLRVDDSGAQIVNSYDGFDTPSKIIIGKWDGAHNNLIYVVDELARRLRVFEDSGDRLIFLKTYRGNYKQYFTDLETDHFGNIYMVDKANSKIFKFTANLEILDSYGGNEHFNSLNAIEVPFGKIEIEGESAFWTGFDQVFAIEKWSDQSGAQRKSLGIKIKDYHLNSDEDVSQVTTSFITTDFSEVTYGIYNEDNKLVYKIEDSLLTSGAKQFVWNRRDENNEYVLPGDYRFDLESISLYTDEKISASAEIYLPLYYHSDCGKDENGDDPFIVQGNPVSWGELNAVEHEDQVLYKFDGLEPDRNYEMAIEFYAGDGQTRLQNVTANGMEIIVPFHVKSTVERKNYFQLPEESYSSGEVLISFNRLEEGSAVVSQIWIKEKIDSYMPQKEEIHTPDIYVLYQNYPNPFNPVTTITFDLPERQFVNLSVFNVLGQKVRTIVNESRDAGHQTTIFDARDLASGVYIYQLRAGKFVQTKKMLILR